MMRRALIGELAGQVVADDDDADRRRAGAGADRRGRANQLAAVLQWFERGVVGAGRGAHREQIRVGAREAGRQRRRRDVDDRHDVGGEPRWTMR